MSSKFKGIAGKRKNTSVDLPNKRPKGNTPDASDPAPSSPPKTGGKGKTEKKNTLIKLNGLLPKVPANAYLNPKARKLFCSVKTYSDFYYATRVFWTSYSAWNRLGTKKEMEEILQKFSLENNQTWHEDENYVQLWRRVWDILYDHYVETVKSYADKYLESPAGIKFTDHITKMRHAKRGAKELNCATLREFEGAKGIEWGASEIAEFWRPLFDVSQTGYLKVIVDRTSVNSVPWPEFDIKAVKTDGHRSWFHRLSEVSSILIAQWILIGCGCSLPGGVPVDVNDGSLRLLLLHVPTPDLSPDMAYQPFEIEDNTLEEWAADFRSRDDGVDPSIPSLRATEFVDVQTMIEDTIEDNPPLAAPILSQAVSEVETSSKVSDDRLQHALDAFPKPPLVINPEFNYDHHGMPTTMAPMYAPALTATDMALVLGSTKTKVAIALALAKEEITGWNLLARECKERMSDWNRQLQALEYQHKLLQSNHSGTVTFAEHTMEPMVAKLDQTQSIIDAARENRNVARFLDRKLKSTGAPNSPSVILPNQLPSTERPSTDGFAPFATEPKTDRQSPQSSPPILNKSVDAHVTDATQPTAGKPRVDPSAFLKPAVQIKSQQDTNSDEMRRDDLIEDDVDDEGSESGADGGLLQPHEDDEMQG